MSKIGKRFEGKVAIITASTQGIGFGIAERLGLEGASVIISSRKQKNVDEAVDKLKSKGIEAFGVVCHVSNAQQRKNDTDDDALSSMGNGLVLAVEVDAVLGLIRQISLPHYKFVSKNLIDQTVQKYGKIDVVVSNAAVNPSVDNILDTKESVLDKLWEINVKASILLLKDASPHLTNNSSVVFVSSIAAFAPQASMAMYGVTKTALLGLTKALASEMAPNTRVNSIAPGFVPTHFADFITSNATIRKSVEEKTLLNRLGTTEDMGAAVAFLASDDAAYITGETLVVAGGLPSRL